MAPLSQLCNHVSYNTIGNVICALATIIRHILF